MNRIRVEDNELEEEEKKYLRVLSNEFILPNIK